jgi:hypothetical protein
MFPGFAEVLFYANRRMFVAKIFSTNNFSGYHFSDEPPPKCHPRAGGDPAPRNEIFIELDPRLRGDDRAGGSSLHVVAPSP